MKSSVPMMPSQREGQGWAGVRVRVRVRVGVRVGARVGVRVRVGA